MSLSETHCTIKEAAGLLQRSIPQVTRYCQEGVLPAEFIGDRWFIARSSLEKFQLPKRGNPHWVKGSAKKKRNRKK